MISQEVILVDENDREIGTMDKMEAHQQGKLHRAFSVFIFNPNKELLIQRRAEGKYHSAGLWTNTCCSHPAPNETVIDAANRRLEEEMGMKANLSPLFQFTYNAVLENQLTEYELDHVLIGFSDEEPQINAKEVSEYRWVTLSQIEKDLASTPEQFTVWFLKIMQEYQDYFQLKPHV